MNTPCNIIQDLLPLYVEDLASAESMDLVREHLKGCRECQQVHSKMSQPQPLPQETDAGAFLKIRSALGRKKLKTGLITFLLTSVFLIAGFFFLTSPQYLPYSPELLKITQSPNGSVLATLGEKARRFEIEGVQNMDSRQFEYNILVWTTTWDELTGKGAEQVVLVNPQGEPVESVWYVNAQPVSQDGQGTLDTLLMGRADGGGRLTLPRLFFSFYLLVSLILLILSAGLLFLFRRHEKLRAPLRIIAFLSLSWLIAHFLVKGLTLPTYQPVREFSAILLAAVPLFVIFLLVHGLYQENQLKARARSSQTRK